MVRTGKCNFHSWLPCIGPIAWHVISIVKDPDQIYSILFGFLDFIFVLWCLFQVLEYDVAYWRFEDLGSQDPRSICAVVD